MWNSPSKTCGMVGAVIAVFIFHFGFARDMFPSTPGGAFDYGWDRALISAFVGAIGGVAGALFGNVMGRLLGEE